MKSGDKIPTLAGTTVTEPYANEHPCFGERNDMKSEVQFALEQQSVTVPSCPVLMVCGTCKYFEPYRDSDTHRIHPSRAGRCGWKMPEIKWPLAYRLSGYGTVAKDPPHPYSAEVWKDTDAKTCACYEPTV